MVYDPGGMRGRVLMVTKTDFAGSPRRWGVARLSHREPSAVRQGFECRLSTRPVPPTASDTAPARAQHGRSLARRDRWLAASQGGDGPPRASAPFRSPAGTPRPQRNGLPALSAATATQLSSSSTASVLCTAACSRTPWSFWICINVEHELLANYAASAANRVGETARPIRDFSRS